jgi:hypothetical protein
MHLQQTISKTLTQLSETIQQLTPDQYVHPANSLFNATIGQHVRHIIELFIQLDMGYTSGVINYDQRKREMRFETNLYAANELLLQLPSSLDKPDKSLLLEMNYTENPDLLLSVASNYYRELAYNLEHTIHHMALIRIGITEIAAISIPANFGIAHSTIQYRATCAQ